MIIEAIYFKNETDTVSIYKASLDPDICKFGVKQFIIVDKGVKAVKASLAFGTNVVCQTNYFPNNEIRFYREDNIVLPLHTVKHHVMDIFIHVPTQKDKVIEVELVPYEGNIMVELNVDKEGRTAIYVQCTPVILPAKALIFPTMLKLKFVSGLVFLSHNVYDDGEYYTQYSIEEVEEQIRKQTEKFNNVLVANP